MASSDVVLPAVRKIVEGVRGGGDAALRRYAAKFDGLPADADLRISREELQRAWEDTSAELQNAMRIAATNIRAFAERQMPQEWNHSPVPGLLTGQVVRALDCCGCYVPSGRYPLPSTLLMTVIPAQVAGVKRIVVRFAAAGTGDAGGRMDAGRRRVLQDWRSAGDCGACLWNGESVAQVDKIVGPGNLLCDGGEEAGRVRLQHRHAGGADGDCRHERTGEAAAIASDLVAQAEHDPEALPIFVTTIVTLAAGGDG